MIETGRNVLLGVSGSIAAFKGAAVASALVQQGYKVRAAITPGAAHFVSPLTFQALTGNAVAVEVWDEDSGSAMGHLEGSRAGRTSSSSPPPARA